MNQPVGFTESQAYHRTFSGAKHIAEGQTGRDIRKGVEELRPLGAQAVQSYLDEQVETFAHGKFGNLQDVRNAAVRVGILPVFLAYDIKTDFGADARPLLVDGYIAGLRAGGLRRTTYRRHLASVITSLLDDEGYREITGIETSDFVQIARSSHLMSPLDRISSWGDNNILDHIPNFPGLGFLKKS